MPVLLEPLATDTLSRFGAGHYARNLCRGALGVVPRGLEDPGFLDLVNHLGRSGYLPQNSKGSSVYDFTYVNGSLPWHTDQGNKLTALLLLEVSDVTMLGHQYSYAGQLITSSGAFPMDPGDIVVFNSDVGHAWLSDHFCTFATVFVRRAIYGR
jgi:hypothetical protein